MATHQTARQENVEIQEHMPGSMIAFAIKQDFILAAGATAAFEFGARGAPGAAVLFFIESQGGGTSTVNTILEGRMFDWPDAVLGIPLGTNIGVGPVATAGIVVSFVSGQGYGIYDFVRMSFGEQSGMDSAAISLQYTVVSRVTGI